MWCVCSITRRMTCFIDWSFSKLFQYKRVDQALTMVQLHVHREYYHISGLGKDWQLSLQREKPSGTSVTELFDKKTISFGASCIICNEFPRLFTWKQCKEELTFSRKHKALSIYCSNTSLFLVCDWVRRCFLRRWKSSGTHSYCTFIRT